MARNQGLIENPAGCHIVKQLIPGEWFFMSRPGVAVVQPEVSFLNQSGDFFVDRFLFSMSNGRPAGSAETDPGQVIDGIMFAVELMLIWKLFHMMSSSNGIPSYH